MGRARCVFEARQGVSYENLRKRRRFSFLNALYPIAVPIILLAGLLEPPSGAWDIAFLPHFPDTVINEGLFKRKLMADLRNYQNRAQAGAHASAEIDQGLRAYMLRIYNLMALGLVITGVMAFGLSSLATTTDQAASVAQLPNGILLTSVGAAVYGSPLKWLVMFAPLIAFFFLAFRVNKMSVSAAQTSFWVYAALTGLSLSSIFIMYTTASIVQTFFITAASFGALSLYGYTTKRDLSAMGSFMVIGLFGILIAMVVNIFLQSSALSFAVSVIGVLVFAGLTAWDTQKLKEMYYEGDGHEVAGRKAVMGALTLYLDFINMFLFLLRLLGNRN